MKGKEKKNRKRKKKKGKKEKRAPFKKMSHTETRSNERS